MEVWAVTRFAGPVQPGVADDAAHAPGKRPPLTDGPQTRLRKPRRREATISPCSPKTLRLLARPRCPVPAVTFARAQSRTGNKRVVSQPRELRGGGGGRGGTRVNRAGVLVIGCPAAVHIHANMPRRILLISRSQRSLAVERGVPQNENQQNSR